MVEYDDQETGRDRLCSQEDNRDCKETMCYEPENGECRMKRYLLLIFIFSLLFNIQFAEATSNSEKTGDILQLIIPTFALATTYIKHNQSARRDFYSSFFKNFLTTYALKISINRKRPNGGNYSFPSGHTSAAFMGASFINRKYGLKRAIPYYLGAIFVGWSRVHAKRHYTSDVLGGVVVGIWSHSF